MVEADSTPRVEPAYHNAGVEAGSGSPAAAGGSPAQNRITTDGVPVQNEEHYLGDGLFVRFDGWQIWLRAPRGGGDHEIAIEPDTWQALRAWLYRHKRLLGHMESSM